MSAGYAEALYLGRRLPLGHANFSRFAVSAPEFWSSWEVYFEWLKCSFTRGETLENALRRFKKKVLQEEIIREVKRHSFYLKPGQSAEPRRRWPASETGRNHAWILSDGEILPNYASRVQEGGWSNTHAPGGLLAAAAARDR